MKCQFCNSEIPENDMENHELICSHNFGNQNFENMIPCEFCDDLIHIDEYSVHINNCQTRHIPIIQIPNINNVQDFPNLNNNQINLINNFLNNLPNIPVNPLQPNANIQENNTPIAANNDENNDENNDGNNDGNNEEDNDGNNDGNNEPIAENNDQNNIETPRNEAELGQFRTNVENFINIFNSINQRYREEIQRLENLNAQAEQEQIADQAPIPEEPPLNGENMMSESETDEDMPDLIEDNNLDNEDVMINNFHYNYPNNLMGGVNLNFNLNNYEVLSRLDNNNVRMGIDMNLVSKNIKLEEETICAICQETFLKNDNMKILNCKHIFCEECLEEWLSENKKCPVCMIELNELKL